MIGIFKENLNWLFENRRRLMNDHLWVGAAYVETKNLDGETSLKYKNVHVDILKYFDTEDKVNMKKDYI